MEWYSYNISDTIKKLNSDLINGLSNNKIKEARKKYGKNVLTPVHKKSFFKKLIGQFSDFMIITLLISAAVSFIVAILNKETDYIDSIIILVIVFINAFIGVMQENKAEESIEALKKLSAPLAKVKREGKIQKILVEDVVPGDIIVLKAGDIVCADAKIIKSNNLKVEESALTGESYAVKKTSKEIKTANLPLSEQKNILFATSSVVLGDAEAIVIETGMNTQVGKIANIINTEKNSATPLQKNLSHVSKILGIAVLIISIIIFILGIMQNIDPLEMFMISISLAVAAIPEGLPAVITVVLAMGVRKMVEKNAIIRKLPAVETLGSADVICSDKTGTLTQNKISLVEICSYNGKENINSEISNLVLTLGILCNNSHFKSKSALTVEGEPTENALLIEATRCNKNKEILDKKYRRVREINFDSNRKLMTTIHLYENGKYRIITKGAPDVLIKKCKYYKTNNKIQSLNRDIIEKLENYNSKMSSQALRVLAIAYKDSDTIPNNDTAENNLIFCGLIGFIDPPRPEVKLAVQKCVKAGIKPVMITGDHVLTAKSIAKQLGIMTNDSQAITGTELDRLSDTELKKDIFKYSVFARVSPIHKAKIVKAFQARGCTVAMTGDGINDAPALKVSDIGCAMGNSGTEVAKSASDIIMTDDNFTTIVEAVRQGRGVYDNIKKSIHFLLSTNVGEVITVLLGFIFRLPSPLLPIHLLWINLVTDSFPALALGMEPIEEDVMYKKPSKYKKGLLSDGLGYNIVVEGCLIGVLGLLAFIIGKCFFDFGDFIIARTMAFNTLSISQLIHCFNVRNKKTIFNFKNLISNPYLIYAFFMCLFLQIIVVFIPQLSIIFRTAQLNILQWSIILVLSIIPTIVCEIEKFINKY